MLRDDGNEAGMGGVPPGRTYGAPAPGGRAGLHPSPPNPTIGVQCTHCGLAVPRALIRPDIAEQFCCNGCSVAFEILNAGGLSQYYRFADRRDVAVQSSGRGFEEFDHPAFADLYVRGISGGRLATELYLEGVHCASCVWLVERVPLLVQGTVRAELDVRRSLARVEWDPAVTSLSVVAQMLDRLGYTPHPFRGVTRDAMRRREDRAALRGIGIAGAIAGNVMLASLALYSGETVRMEATYATLFRWICLGLAVPALLFPGRVFFSGAWAALRTRALHMDLPIAVALGAGFTRGAINTITGRGDIYFDGVTLLIFLLLVGRYLQQRGQRAAADASELLYSLAPSSACVVNDDGSERQVPTSGLLPGMFVLVKSGETFAVDGTIADGSTTVNVSLLTGESRPVAAKTGDAVFAGTLNIGAPVQVSVDAAGETTRVAGILRQVEESARRRAPIVLLANRMAGVFIALVLTLAVVTFLLWHARNPALAWDNAIALLIVTCPCALALATPLAVTAALGRAARAGIFIKGGDALERLSRAGELILDKTGTLTEGEGVVVEWHGPASARALVLALEAGSTHPIAASFRHAWPDLVVEQVADERHDIGHGITGMVRGARVAIGSPAFIATQAAGTPMMLSDPTLTSVVVSVDGAIVAIAGIGDRARPDAAASLQVLRRLGWHTMLLSGDDPRVAAAMGTQLGFAPGDVTGSATPERKLAFVRERIAERRDGAAVVMVGDGVNDAAAIAAASVGVGVQGGAEACLATADVYLTTPGLESLVRLTDGSRRAMHVIRRNIAWALAYNMVGITLAMTGHIRPILAAMLMPASSLTVVLSSWLGRTFVAAPPVVAPAPDEIASASRRREAA